MMAKQTRNVDKTIYGENPSSGRSIRHDEFYKFKEKLEKQMNDLIASFFDIRMRLAKLESKTNLYEV